MSETLIRNERLQITALHGGPERGPCIQIVFNADYLTWRDVKTLVALLLTWLQKHRPEAQIPSELQARIDAAQGCDPARDDKIRSDLARLEREQDLLLWRRE